MREVVERDEGGRDGGTELVGGRGGGGIVGGGEGVFFVALVSVFVAGVVFTA